MKLYITCKPSILNILLSLFITIFILFLLFNSQNISHNIQNTTDIFIHSLLPAVLPFIFLTNILIESNIGYNLSFGLSKIICKIFKISPASCPAIIIGMLLGYPNAAKFISTLYEKRIITSSECNHLLAFTSNASPAYILSTIGIFFYNNITIGIILILSHLISSFILGYILSFKYKHIIQQTLDNSYTVMKKNNGFNIISTSVFSTLKTCGLIYIFMVIFSTFAHIICNTLNLNNNISAIVTGIFELTNGMNLISKCNLALDLKVILSSFILSFGSFMIIYQIYAVVYTCKVSFISFATDKLIHGITSSAITYILLRKIPIQDLNVPVFSNIYNTNILLPELVYIISTILCTTFILFKTLKYKRKRLE